MTTNSFTVALAPGVLKDLGDNGYALCMSNTVNDTNNVVAVALQAKDYSARNSFSWVVKYFVAASQKAWQSGGVKVEVGSAVKPVDLEQGYRLPNWVAPPEIFNHDIKNALRFNPVTVDAAPVVYLEQLGTHNGKSQQTFDGPMPIYIAPFLALSGNSVTLTPKRTAKVFFQQFIETSGMTSLSDMYLPVDIDLTTKPTGQTLTLGDDRRWTKS